MHIHLIFSCKYLGLEWLNHIMVVELSKKLLTVFLGGCNILHSPQQCTRVPVPPHSGHLVSYALFYMCSDLLFCSAARPCLTLCDAMDCSTPGTPVLPILCVHVHWIRDAIKIKALNLGLTLSSPFQSWWLLWTQGGASGEEPFCQCRKPRFDPWVRKIS